MGEWTLRLLHRLRKRFVVIKAVDWVDKKGKRCHLQDIPFPKLARRGRIDVLLGTDNYQLMSSKEEVIGGVEDPCARLFPLGWTAVGRINMKKKTEKCTIPIYVKPLEEQFCGVATIVEQQDDLNTTLKRFWDETMGIRPSRPVMTPDESVTWRKVRESMKFEKDRYLVAVAWWDDRPSLPKNRSEGHRRVPE